MIHSVIFFTVMLIVNVGLSPLVGSHTLKGQSTQVLSQESRKGKRKRVDGSKHNSRKKLQTFTIPADSPEFNSTLETIKPHKKVSKGKPTQEGEQTVFLGIYPRREERPIKPSLKNNHYGYHAIHVMITSQNKEEARRLLEETPDLVNFKTSRVFAKDSEFRVDNQSSPLHFAVVHNDLEAIQLLCTAFGDPRLTNEKGRNCLHLAITKDVYENEIQIKMIELLLSFDPVLINVPSSVVKKNNEGYLPLHYAVLYNKSTIVEVLIRHGAHIISRSHKGETVLHTLFKKESYRQDIVKKQAILKTLMSNLAPRSGFTEFINQKDTTGNTALHMAVGLGDKFIELIKMMVEAGASIDIKNKGGKTPCMIALENDSLQNVALVECFFGKYPEVVVREKQRRSPTVSSFESPPLLGSTISQNHKKDEVEIGAWLSSLSTSPSSSSSSSSSSQGLKDLSFLDLCSESIPSTPLLSSLLPLLPHEPQEAIYKQKKQPCHDEPDSQLSQLVSSIQEPLSNIKEIFRNNPHYLISTVQQQILEPLLPKHPLKSIFQALIKNKKLCNDEMVIMLAAFKNLIQTQSPHLLKTKDREELGHLLKDCDSFERFYKQTLQ